MNVELRALPVRLVLDTNVVLDWLVFADPALQPLRASLLSQRAFILTHPIFVAELRRVLGYPKLRLDSAEQARVLQTYLLSTSLIDSCDLKNLPDAFPRCRDPDDDPFLAFSHACGATLVSKDREILRLRKRARRFGLRILAPGELDDERNNGAAYHHAPFDESLWSE